MAWRRTSSKGAGQRLQVWSVSEAEREAKMKEELEGRQAERRREKEDGGKQERVPPLRGNPVQACGFKTMRD